MKILEDMEDMVFYLALFAVRLAIGMVAVMYVTLRSLKSLKGTTLVEGHWQCGSSATLLHRIRFVPVTSAA